jgi:DNA-binding helix-turn-helix protein
MRYGLENRLKEIRLAQEKQQEEIADFAGISRRTYIRYENGSILPNLVSAIRIADALGVDNLRDIWAYKNPH